MHDEFLQGDDVPSNKARQGDIATPEVLNEDILDHEMDSDSTVVNLT